MTSSPCQVCNTPVHGVYLCTTCTRKLRDIIATISEYHGLAWDLQLSIAKQSQFRSQTDGAGGKGHEKPLMIDMRASEAARCVREVLDRWAGVIRRDTSRPQRGPICHDCEHPSCLMIWWIQGLTPARVTSDTLVDLAAWMTKRVAWLQHHPQAGQAHHEILTAVRLARRAVDAPLEKTYAGPCDVCGQDVYAIVGRTRVECRNPEHDHDPVSWDVTARREWMLEAMREVLAPVATVAQAISTKERPVTQAMLKGYIRRGKLVPVDLGAAGYIVRVGDAIDALAPKRGVVRELLSA